MVPMTRTRAGLAAALAAVACAAGPASASAGRVAEPLVDAAPTGSAFRDAVIRGGARRARAAQVQPQWYSYPTKDGRTVVAAISRRYGGSVTTAVAQSYVDFIDGLVHGPELSSLRIYIAPLDEVRQECGGAHGVMACYESRSKVMVVPGENLQTSSGVTTSYIVAHEYGHHVSAMRSHAPFSAFHWGPKIWSSYQLVCNRTAAGLLAPGDEGQLYFSNPAESWAETYAQLKYPDIPWQFTTVLKPDAGAFAAAREDVLNPWSADVRKTFKGSFGRRGSNTRRFSFDLNLDGALSIRLAGPRASDYDLVASSDGREVARTSSAGSRDSLRWRVACRERQTERVTISVKRKRGSGPFTLRLSYAG